MVSIHTEIYRLRVMVALLATATATLATWNALDTPRGEIRATSLVIVDKEGNQRIELNAASNNPALIMRDAHGQLRVMVAGFDTEPLILVYSAEGQPAWTVPPASAVRVPLREMGPGTGTGAGWALLSRTW